MERLILNNKVGRIIFCTGAGASEASGIPTFRDSNGLWKNYDPKYLASNGVLDIDPVAVNAFYDSRRALLEEVEPNYFHYFISLMQDKYGEDRVGIITTNVDDLHERAESKNIIRLHGSLKEVVRNGKVINMGYKPVNYKLGEDLVRPNVVMFGEGAYYKDDKIYNAYKDADKLLKSLNEKDIVFIVGCSNLIVHFPYECEQYTNGTKVVLVNPNENGESFINNESLIKKKACDAVPDIEDMIMKHLK